MPPTATAPLSYCRRILPGVSRTFALTIPVLDEPLQSRVGVAYLLCRIADTIEDRADLGQRERLALFRNTLDLLRDPRNASLRDRFQGAWPATPDPAHQDLMENAGSVLDAFVTFPEPVREAITACVDEMVDGMAAFCVGDAVRPVTVCTSLEDLERYCHFVAGTVGILLSRLFADALGPGWLTPERLEQGRRFGIGLQLTNVLKDQGADRSRGVSYVPDRWLEAGTVSPEGRRVLISRALTHLDAAHAYVLSLPASRTDMRLFCLWASHLALATLRLAASASGGPAKVSREAVWEILEAARDAAANDSRLDALHLDLTRAVRDALPGS